MISKKVCMIGAFAVGKTSLVRRYVDNIYDERYLTTVGVKIDKKVVETEGRTVNMMLWDLAGEDAFESLKLDYVRGSSGFILVCDGTRAETLEKAIELGDRIQHAFGRMPFVLAVNKVDLRDEWEIDEGKLVALARRHQCEIYHTSALSGADVEPLFEGLAAAMVKA